jgi:hypothetical protein
MSRGLVPCCLVLWVVLSTRPASADDTPVPADTSAETASPPSSWAVPTGHALALMTGMRVTEAFIWPDPFADLSWSHVRDNYVDAYTLPPKWDGSRAWFEWDGDPWYVNAIGHAAFGSELYLRARTCRQTPLAALAFTAAASTVWEYGFEANGVRPSALDLWYTPLSGMLFGELRHVAWSAAAQLRDRSWRQILMTVFDPLGELERAVFSLPC